MLDLAHIEDSGQIQNNLLINIPWCIECSHVFGSIGRLHFDPVEGARKEMDAGRGDNEQPGYLEDSWSEVDHRIVLDSSAKQAVLNAATTLKANWKSRKLM